MPDKETVAMERTFARTKIMFRQEQMKFENHILVINRELRSPEFLSKKEIEELKSVKDKLIKRLEYPLHHFTWDRQNEIFAEELARLNKTK